MMTELGLRSENVEQKPFVIRGHHLELYSRIAWRNRVPSGLAELTIKEWEDTQRLMQKSNGKATYLKDVLGSSIHEARRFKGNKKEAYEGFLQLSNDHPIEIVEGVPDNICYGCAIGKHCRTASQFGGDRLYVNKFINYLNKHGLPKPAIVFENILFVDTKKSRQTRRVKTTVGVVKKYIAEGPVFLFPPLAGTLHLILAGVQYQAREILGHLSKDTKSKNYF